MRALIGRRSRRLVIITAALFAVAGGIAYATIPNAAGVYTACKLNALGTIRLIDPSLPSTSLLQHCTSLETQITWNQQGVPGTAGTNGTNGTNGKDGVNGLPGAAGKDGTNGTSGKDGVSVTNTAEPQGLNCANGGAQFAVGLGAPTFACNGTNGTDGKNGTNGTNGKDGTNGSSLTKIEDLNGVACTDVNGAASNVVVSLAADGSLSLRCLTVPPPPGPVTLLPALFTVTSPVAPATATHTFTLSNNTANPINISSVQQDGVEVGGCGTQVAGGATCAITVTVTVAVLCDVNGTTVTVIGTDSVTGSPFTVTAALNLVTQPIHGCVLGG